MRVLATLGVLLLSCGSDDPAPSATPASSTTASGDTLHALCVSVQNYR